MRSVWKTAVAASVAIVILAGCGGGGSSTPETGTGYYIDSAVSGVDYTCGSQSGKTGSDGKFTFEKGKGCTFSVAGIKLRKVAADQLGDNAKIIEDDLKTARFLQSIDTDGNLSNGIQITDKIISILEKALKQNNITTVPQGDNLTTVVEEVTQQDDSFKGGVKTEQEVEEHLNKTKGDVTKALLAGKTFYSAETDQNGKLKSITFNAQATMITFSDKHTSDTVIAGNTFTIADRDGQIGHYQIIEKHDKYLLVKNIEGGSTFKLYNSKADAEAALGGSTSGDFSSYFVGKTYYVINDYNKVEKIVFENDGHTLTDYWPKEGVTTTSVFTYKIENNTLTITGTDGDGNPVNETISGPITETDTYIAFANKHGKFFKTRAAADAAAQGSSSSASGSLQTQLLNGYVWGEYKQGATLPKTCYIFNSANSITGYYDGDISKKYEGSYEINGNVISYPSLDVTDTLTQQADGTFAVHKVWPDDVDDRIWKITPNCTDIMKNDEGGSSSAGYYHLQESDIAGHTIKVGDPSKDKQYFSDHTFTSLESNPANRDHGTWSISSDGKLVHIWSGGSEEIHHFSAKPAKGVTITNETYNATGTITEYL